LPRILTTRASATRRVSSGPRTRREDLYRQSGRRRRLHNGQASGVQRRPTRSWQGACSDAFVSVVPTVPTSSLGALLASHPVSESELRAIPMERYGSRSVIRSDCCWLCKRATIPQSHFPPSRRGSIPVESDTQGIYRGVFMDTMTLASTGSCCASRAPRRTANRTSRRSLAHWRSSHGC